MENIFIQSNLIFILKGIIKTLFIVLCAVIPSIFLGTVLAVFQKWGNKFIRFFILSFIDIIRNIPNMLWIYIVFLLFNFQSEMSAILSFILFSSAAFAEIIRGGLNALEQGQIEAAFSQGFTFFQSLVYIILPQMVKNCIITISSQIITIVKDTSLLWSVAAIQELTGNTFILMNKYHTAPQIFMLYGILALIYLFINLSIAHTFRFFKKKMWHL